MHAIKRNAGFTLYELMVTVAVASVIISFAVPGFQNFSASSRSVTDTNDFVTALNLGRSEAIRRGAPINVCASSDAATCNSADWSTGWIVRIPGGQVLRTWPARKSGAGVLSGNVSTIQYQARGSLAIGATEPQLNLQLPHCKGKDRRDIRVNRAGSITVTRVDCA